MGRGTRVDRTANAQALFYQFLSENNAGRFAIANSNLTNFFRIYGSKFSSRVMFRVSIFTIYEKKRKKNGDDSVTVIYKIIKAHAS